MLPIIEDPNTQKQLKRSEQIKKWNEREMMSPTLTSIANNNNNNNNMDINNEDEMTLNENNNNEYQRSSKVRFPKGCVFLSACSSGDTDEVRAHLKLGVNINTTNIDGLTALHQACIDANIEMVKFLVDNQADINSQDNEGWSPLHAAVSVGNLEVSKYLISKGARLNICNNDSDLPIDLCDSSNLQMKEFLDDEMKRQGIDADYERKKEELIMYEDARDKQFEDKIHAKTGATPLHVSAAKGYTRVMRILLQSGADVNALDKDGWTPLHAAAHWEQEEACKILAEYGADFEARNYSEQTPFDVCEGEMINKLKQLETSSKSNDNKLTDVTSINNKLKFDSRNRSINKPMSDELAKPSIVRIVNEEKVNDKKILLSPVVSTVTPPPLLSQHSITINSINNNESNEAIKTNENHFNKENQSNGSSFNATTSTTIANNGQDQSKTVFTTKASSLVNNNRAKPGLHESLKSLSAQVRMMDEEKDDLTEKPTRWGPTDTSTTTTTTFKRRAIPDENGSKLVNSSAIVYSTTTNLANNNSNTTPLSPTSQSNNDSSIPASPNSVNNNNNNNSDPNSRRYSSAPVASKDEQAELIRKQKAKLERHFRRSTTAVSYEDIKSAEATIKSGVPTSSTSVLNKIEEKTPVSSPTSTNDSINIPPSTPPPPIPTTTTTTTTTTLTSTSYVPPVQASQTLLSNHNSGVTSLSTLYGESLKQNSYYHTPATFTSNSSITPLAQVPTSTSNTQGSLTSSNQSLIDAQKSLMSKTLFELNATTPPPPPPPTTNVNNTNEQSEIANDIETDKLLNVIEKSKGFSDSKSTTATRRLRNRQMPFFGINNPLNDETQLGGNNVKKINKLVWNPEKLEIEYKEEDHQQQILDQSDSNSKQLNTSSELVKQQQNITDISNENILPMNNSASTNQSHSGRSLFRFDNTNTNTNNNTQLNNRTNIKRSVSQATTTDRRPVSTTGTSPTPASLPETKIITDYQLAYEQTKKENESLNQIIIQLKKELDESKRNQMNNENGSLDKREKRAFERRISELEEEVKKVDNLKQDNSRLKEENAALIRVISKLSK